jgi:hypothetical protein
MIAHRPLPLGLCKTAGTARSSRDRRDEVSRRSPRRLGPSSHPQDDGPIRDRVGQVAAPCQGQAGKTGKSCTVMLVPSLTQRGTVAPRRWPALSSARRSSWSPAFGQRLSVAPTVGARRRSISSVPNRPPRSPTWPRSRRRVDHPDQRGRRRRWARWAADEGPAGGDPGPGTSQHHKALHPPTTRHFAPGVRASGSFAVPSPSFPTTWLGERGRRGRKRARNRGQERGHSARTRENPREAGGGPARQAPGPASPAGRGAERRRGGGADENAAGKEADPAISTCKPLQPARIQGTRSLRPSSED